MISSFLRSVIRRKPSRIHLADVAGVEPPLGVDHLRRLLLHAPVALHDVGALGQDLAVLRDPHLDPGDRLADGAHLDRSSRVLTEITGEVSESPYPS